MSPQRRMSPLFDADLGERIAHFVQQDDGRLITGMVVVMDYIDEDGVECTSLTCSPEQKNTTTAGLLALGVATSKYEMTQYVAHGGEEGGIE